jgi:hypothetical protein
MEIINKLHSKFRKNTRSNGVPTISISLKMDFIYFPVNTCEKFALSNDLKIHFVSELDRLYFFTNTDKDGLCLSYSSKDRGLRLGSSTLIKILKEKFPSKIKAGNKFILKESVAKFNGCPTVEVLLHKKIN